MCVLFFSRIYHLKTFVVDVVNICIMMDVFFFKFTVKMLFECWKYVYNIEHFCVFLLPYNMYCNISHIKNIIYHKHDIYGSIKFCLNVCDMNNILTWYSSLYNLENYVIVLIYFLFYYKVQIISTDHNENILGILIKDNTTSNVF